MLILYRQLDTARRVGGRRQYLHEQDFTFLSVKLVNNGHCPALHFTFYVA